MKNNFCLSLLGLLLVSLMFSCDKTDIDFENDFEKSQKAWKAFKKSSGNSYKYTVVFSSWAGMRSETTITVSNGKIVQREYKYSKRENLTVIDEFQWIENENEINTHKDAGAEPLTLDEIYAKAESDWLVKRDKATTYFEAKNDGMISSCGYVNDGCQDDCFNGIKISYIGIK